MLHILKIVLPTLVGAALVLFPFRWCSSRGESPEEYGLSWKLKRRALVECLVLTACVLAPLTYVSVNWPYEQLPRSSTLFRTIDIASAGLAAAFIEEIFFRGWVQPMFRKRINAVPAIVITSALFALSHVFVTQSPFLVAVFFPGCIMGFLRERHGNISTSTLFHGLSNVWAVWFAPLIWPKFDTILPILLTLLGFPLN